MVKVFAKKPSENPSFWSRNLTCENHAFWIFSEPQVIKIFFTQKSSENRAFKIFSESQFSSAMVKVFAQKPSENPSFWSILQLWESEFSPTMVNEFPKKHSKNHSLLCISELWISIFFLQSMVKEFTPSLIKIRN